MGGLLAYSLESGLLMLAMLLAYKVFLARENQHDYNRKVLLTIYLIAFSAMPISSSVSKLIPRDTPPHAINNLNLTFEAVTTVNSTPFWGTLLIWVFMAGAAIVAIKTLITWARLISIIRSGEKVRADGYIYILTDNDHFAPFSWIRYIVISRSDYTNCRSAIVTHEMRHIASHHWIDLIIAQFVCVINWFNPAAWLMREELMLVHEYQADMAVIDSGHSPKEYQMLLIKKTVGARFPSLANSLNHSKLKKRITMMHKSKSSAGRKLKALALVPTLALALGMVTVPAVRAAISTVSSSKVSIGKSSENMPMKKKKSASFTVKSLDNYGNETTVVINGENLGNNITVSGATFTTMGKTYKDKAIDCTLSGDGNAAITIKFPFLTEFENTSMSLTVNGVSVPEKG